MSKYSSDLSCVVLAGGNSVRFRQTHGINKALFEFDGISFVKRVTSTLATITSDIQISINNSSEARLILKELEEFNIGVVRDNLSLSKKGPLLGIFSALLNIQSSEILFVPVDYPFVTKYDLEYLINIRSTNNADIATYLDQNNFPTLSLFVIRRDYVIEKLNDLLDVDDNRLSSIYRGASEVDLVRLVNDDHNLININQDLPENLPKSQNNIEHEIIKIQSQGNYWDYQQIISNSENIDNISRKLKSSAQHSLKQELTQWQNYGIDMHIRRDIEKLRI